MTVASAPRNRPVRITYIGGPTALLEFAGARFLTDPTFDPGGTAYPTPHYTLHKTAGPAVQPAAILPVDAVLLSHDHHFDNLDHAGRALLSRAGLVLTTPAGAQRLGGAATGLKPWQSAAVPARQGGVVRVTSTPARHGAAGADRGPVTGFVLASEDYPYEASGGYPYFVQAYGKATWDHAPRSPITDADVRVGAPEAEAELAVGFFGSRYERATPAEREYMRAMAALSTVDGEGEAVPTADVAR